MKIPPVIKVYEALSVIASKRFKFQNNEAIIYSSDYQKQYQVKWLENKYYANDNGSYWQGYPGYPIIAVLMLQKKLLYTEDILKYFKNINWHDLNLEYKRDYNKVIEVF